MYSNACFSIKQHSSGDSSEPFCLFKLALVSGIIVYLVCLMWQDPDISRALDSVLAHLHDTRGHVRPTHRRGSLKSHSVHCLYPSCLFLPSTQNLYAPTPGTGFVVGTTTCNALDAVFLLKKLRNRAEMTCLTPAYNMLSGCYSRRPPPCKAVVIFM